MNPDYKQLERKIIATIIELLEDQTGRKITSREKETDLNSKESSKTA